MPLPDDRGDEHRRNEHRRNEPSVPPTSVATLVVAGLTTAALSWLVISRYYSSVPDFPVLPAVTLLGLAALEFFAAFNTKARIDRKAGTEPVDPLLVARFVVLAKASALAAALFLGMYAGSSIWLLSEYGHNVHAANDLPPALVGLVGAIALVTAALLLERACRVPPPPPKDSGRSSEPATDTEDADS